MHIEESEKVEDLLRRGEGTREEKPLRLVVGRLPFAKISLISLLADDNPQIFDDDKTQYGTMWPRVL